MNCSIDQMSTSLSVVMPAYNEAQNIRRSIEAFSIYHNHVDHFEMIIVDDGSTDETSDVVHQVMSEYDYLRLITLPHNQGYGAALWTGLKSASMERVFFTDSDMQFDPAELMVFLRLSPYADLILGYRAQRQDPWIRRLNAFVWSKLVRKSLGVKVNDLNCAYKLFNRSVLDQIEPLSKGAAINADILLQAQKNACRWIEVPVEHYPRHLGVQTGAKPKVISKALFDLASLYKAHLL
ncbi:MAG: cell wall biosynthesis glycosyltransferase [Proteobacteria bacterium]|nr:cell wall biosynthesis glycosyltransferase [Pseudomonadota bacterium]